MMYRNIRDFLAFLESQRELKRIQREIDMHLEVTEICQRTLRKNGPALLFEKPKDHTIPVLGNLFGTTKRVMAAIGCKSTEELQGIGRMLAFLKEPGWPRELSEVFEKLPAFQRLLK